MKIKKMFFYMFFLSAFILSASVYAQDAISFAEQIHDTKLTSISTEELIQVYLNSMYAGYIFIYDDVNTAFKRANNDFNGIRELLTRKDAGEKLVEFYRKADPQNSVDWKLRWEPKGYPLTFSLTFLEVILAQETILNQLSDSQIKTLVSELLKKNNFYTLHPKIYSMLCKQYNLYSMAKVIVSKERNNNISQSLLQTPETNSLLKTGKLLNMNASALIIENARKFLNTY